MPSLIKKIRSAALGEDTNPYAKRDNPSNPSYNPTAVRQGADPLSSTPRGNANPTTSPRGSIDYLAEARRASGRDPVTGKKSAPKASTKSKSLQNIRNKVRGGPSGGESSRSGGASASRETPYNPATDPANPFADPEAYTNARSKAPAQVQHRQQTHEDHRGDARYEQYIWQMKERELARLAWQEPAGGSFYAPPRRPTVARESYASGWGADIIFAGQVPYTMR
ncbi:hypothetical protein DM02DRAFT_131430 [Periconia macrospinosa]|uniref:Uncharacterized protein n=1 Tax=Periconia macrospinosa TaxID=97972 RepID=A0A2V1DD07_9PLEO|nr:hypothetical protein DM02DRAFT_131430 [Periconia macrospinosa]